MSDQRLFISHASEDEAVVNRIVAYLEERGVPCWIAGRDIPPKAIYAEEITHGIRTGSACGVIVSRAANASAAIKRELELASHYGKPFIPIRIDATEPGPGLDYYLRNTQWINFQRDGDRALDRIVAHLAGGAAPPRIEPSPKARKLPPAVIAAAALAAVVLLLGGGWALMSNLNEPSTVVADAPHAAPDAAPEETAPSPTDDPNRAERERLQKERDDALAAARRAEETLAAERAHPATIQPAPVEEPRIAGAWRAYFVGDDPAQISWIVRFNSDGTFRFEGASDNGTWRLSGETLTMTREGVGSVSGRFANNAFTIVNYGNSGDMMFVRQ